MLGWDTWKKGFDAWERATADYLEVVLKSPLVLGPAGMMLSSLSRTKVLSDRAWTMWWGAVGLPTKRDQERALHAINELQSKLLDLEERLMDSERS